MDKTKDGLKQFMRLCHECKDNNMLSEIFDLFFTHEERDNLALRYLIIRALIKQEKSQRDMAEHLNVSIAKITRGSNELKRMSKKLLQFLKENIESPTKN